MLPDKYRPCQGKVRGFVSRLFKNVPLSYFDKSVPSGDGEDEEGWALGVRGRLKKRMRRGEFSTAHPEKERKVVRR
jgi:hypothetical protein